MQDVGAYLRDHPEVGRRAIRSVKIIDVNAATLKIFRAPAKDDIIRSLEPVSASCETGVTGIVMPVKTGIQAFWRGPLDSRLRGNDGGGRGRRLRGNDGGGRGRRLRGNDGGGRGRRLCGSDGCD